MKAAGLYAKAKRTITGIILQKIAGTPLQFRIYRSYWHMRLTGTSAYAGSTAIQYMAQLPNYGAGIGHQLANWNSGYYYAGLYHTAFAHFPFSNSKWEKLLGFGEQEITAASLLKSRKVKKVRLPRFNSDSAEELALVGRIIQSYKKKTVLFLLAQDQGYMRQCDTHADLSEKFFNAPARKEDKLLYTAGNFNIAIHIRRGDIGTTIENAAAIWKERWLTNDYYVTILRQVLAALEDQKNIQVYLFSQGNKEDFPEFLPFSNMHYCMDVNAYDSFVHLVNADILISSKSSFSYKPALLSKGTKICPAGFWHAYPLSPDFIVADEDGNFDIQALKKIQSKLVSL